MASIIDNLGRKIDESSMSLAELKGLVASLMNDKVGNKRPIDDKKNPDTALTSLRTMFEKYTKDFSKEMAEQKRFLADVVRALQSVKTQKETQPKKDRPTKEEQLSLKAEQGLYNTFAKRGSGYTHDIYVEKAIYSLIKTMQEIHSSKSGTWSISADNMISEIDSNMAAIDRILEETYAYIKTATSNTSASASAAPNTSASASAAANRGASAGAAANTSRPTIRTEDWFIENRRTFTFWGAFWSDQMQSERRFHIQQLKDQIEAHEQNVELSRRYQQRLQEQRVDMFKQAFSTVKNGLSDLTGINVYDTVFKNTAKNELKFIQDVRQVAFQIDGVTGSMHELQRSYENIETTTYLTGKTRAEFQQEYIKSLKSGLKDQQKAKQLTVSQLFTEEQLGLQAGELGDTFRSYAMSGKMTNAQINDMSRGMLQVQRFTGLTGEAMRDVIASSKKFSDNLRNAGHLTSQANTNFMELVANSKKLEIEDAMNPILDAISSGNKFLFNSSNETKNLLLVAAGSVGKVPQLLQGTLGKTKDGLKDLAKGIGNAMQGLGVSSLDEFEKLNDAQKQLINNRAYALYGKDFAELARMQEAVKESSKTYSERLTEIGNKLNKNKQIGNLTATEEKKLLEEEIKLKNEARMNILATFNKAVGSADNIEQALSSFSDKKGQFADQFQALGLSGKNTREQVESAMRETVTSLNKSLQEAGKSGLGITAEDVSQAFAKQGGEGTRAVKELQEKIDKGNQELVTVNKNNTDPLSGILFELKKLNDTLGDKLQVGLSYVFGNWGAKVATTLAAMLTGLTVLGGMVGAIAYVSRVMAHFRRRGSNYVHDIHTEEILKRMENILVILAKRGVQPPTVGGHTGDGVGGTKDANAKVEPKDKKRGRFGRVKDFMGRQASRIGQAASNFTGQFEDVVTNLLLGSTDIIEAKAVEHIEAKTAENAMHMGKNTEQIAEKAGKTLKGVKGLTKGLGIAAIAADAAMTGWNMLSNYSDVQEKFILGEISEKEKDTQLALQTGETVGRLGGATVGASAGGWIGGLLGSIVPGAGTAIGAILGTTIGGMAGDAIGSALGQTTMFETIGSWINTGMSSIYTAVSSAWGFVKNLASSAWDYTKAAAATSWDYTKAAAAKSYEYAKSIGSSIWDYTTNTVPGLSTLFGSDVAAANPVQITNAQNRNAAEINSRLTGNQEAMYFASREKASLNSNKTQIESTALDGLKDESTKQSEQFATMISLLEELTKSASGSSEPVRSSFAESGMSANNPTMKKPANYYRNTIGLVSQGSAKQILNYGMPNG